jgi:hypothetical protein
VLFTFSLCEVSVALLQDIGEELDTTGSGLGLGAGQMQAAQRQDGQCGSVG